MAATRRPNTGPYIVSWMVLDTRSKTGLSRVEIEVQTWAQVVAKMRELLLDGAEAASVMFA